MNSQRTTEDNNVIIDYGLFADTDIGNPFPWKPLSCLFRTPVCYMNRQIDKDLRFVLHFIITDIKVDIKVDFSNLLLIRALTCFLFHVFT